MYHTSRLLKLMRSRPARLYGRQTEIADFDGPIVMQENIVALQVTMYYVLSMQVTEKQRDSA